MIKRLSSFMIILIAFSSCGENTDSYIPNVAVNCQISLNDSKYSGLQTSGNVAFVDNQGVAGIVVYNGINGFVSYDRCSTVNPDKKNKLIWKSTDPNVLIDTASGAKFSLLDGAPSKAPASVNLKRYSIEKLNNLTLIITN